MKKPVYYIFIALLALAVTKPIMEVQYAHEGRYYHGLGAAVPGMPYMNFNVSIADPELDPEEAGRKIAALAKRTGVNIFFRDPESVLLSDSPVIDFYWYITDYEYLARMPSKNRPATAEEFNDGGAVYSTGSKEHRLQSVLTRGVYSITSIKNYKGVFAGQFNVSARELGPIKEFYRLAQSEISELRFISFEESGGPDIRFERPAPLREFFLVLYEYFIFRQTALLAILFLTLLFILMGVGADSRKILIKKMNGYGDGSIFLEYLRMYVPPVFAIGSAIFPPAFFLFGGNAVPAFWAAYLKYEFALLAFSAAIVLCLLAALVLIAKLQPVDLIKGKSAGGFLSVCGGLAKAVMLIALVPAMLAQYHRVKGEYDTYLRLEESKRIYKNHFSLQSRSTAVQDAPMEVYRLLEDTGILFSENWREIENIGSAGISALIDANSSLINSQNLMSGGEPVRIPMGKQALILSDDIDLGRLKASYDYIGGSLSHGDLNSAPTETVEIIRLDPGQEVFAPGYTAYYFSSFVIKVNTSLPINLVALHYIDPSAEKIKNIQETLDGAFGKNLIQLKPYTDNSSDWEYLFKLTVNYLIEEGIGLLLLVCALLLAAAQLYRSLFELWKKRLAVGYMHGRGIFAGMALPLLVSLGVNIVLSYGLWLRILNNRRTLYLRDYSLWQLAVLIAGLCALEALVWALTVRTLGKRRLEALKEI